MLRLMMKEQCHHHHPRRECERRRDDRHDAAIVVIVRCSLYRTQSTSLSSHRCRRGVGGDGIIMPPAHGWTLVGGGQFYRRTEQRVVVVVVVVVISVSRRRWQASVREPRRHGRCATPATRTAVRVDGRWATTLAVSGRGPSMSDGSSGLGLRWSPK